MHERLFISSRLASRIIPRGHLKVHISQRQFNWRDDDDVIHVAFSFSSTFLSSSVSLSTWKAAQDWKAFPNSNSWLASTGLWKNPPAGYSSFLILSYYHKYMSYSTYRLKFFIVKLPPWTDDEWALPFRKLWKLWKLKTQSFSTGYKKISVEIILITSSPVLARDVQNDWQNQCHWPNEVTDRKWPSFERLFLSGRESVVPYMWKNVWVQSRPRQNLIFYVLFHNCLGSIDSFIIALIYSSICSCVVH